jgi:hypothetical protein
MELQEAFLRISVPLTPVTLLRPPNHFCNVLKTAASFSPSSTPTCVKVGGEGITERKDIGGKNAAFSELRRLREVLTWHATDP